MAYLSNVIGLWKFNQNLFDAALNNSFVLNNEDPYQPGPVVSGSYSAFNRFDLFTNKYQSIYGLDVSNKVSYEADVTVYTSGDFTVGFWMKTTTPLGYVRHAVTREKEPKTAPVIGKGDSSVVGNEEIIEFTNFIIIEQAANSTQNRLVLMLSETGGSISNTIVSSAYTPGLHHYLVTYDQGLGQARIDVDGVLGSWQTATTSLYQSASTIKINDLNPNYTAHQTDSTAIFRDLYFKNISSLDENEAIRNMQLGVDYVTDSDLSNKEYANFAFSFSQPNTIATNAIIVNGSSIYLGRANGELLKGEQPIWDNEFTFDSIQKNKLLDTSEVGTITYTDNGISFLGSFIKV